MVNLHYWLGRVKDDLTNLLDDSSVFSICRSADYRWRMGPLNPAVLIRLFVLQILHSNTAANHLRHLSGLSFTASAYCQARMRLPLKVIILLVRRVAQTLTAVCDQQSLWLGHRVWRIDGSGVSMPDTAPLQKRFGQPSVQPVGCGFPVASILVRIHAGTGLWLDLLVGALVDQDMMHMPRAHERLRANDVIVADRGFCSFAHLALVLQAKMHAVFRLHQRVKVEFTAGRVCALDRPQAQRRHHPNSRWVRRLGQEDQVVRYFKCVSPKPRWMSQQPYESLPDQIDLRELRYRVGRKGFRTRVVTLVTTLLDPQVYPKSQLTQLYGDRWQIEVDLRHIKITLGMDVLRCKTVEGVMKELWMFVLVYNLIRLAMLQAAQRQRVGADRISFIDAQRYLCVLLHSPVNGDLIVNPTRPNRYEPRVIKRRMKKYPLMVKPRHVLRKAMGAIEVRA